MLCSHVWLLGRAHDRRRTKDSGEVIKHEMARNGGGGYERRGKRHTRVYMYIYTYILDVLKDTQ
jgi:hypothetical protein